MMKYLLGVNAGNTTTIAVITDVHGNVKGVGHAAGRDSCDDGNALHNVAHAIEWAFDQANAVKCGEVTRNKIVSAVFSMVGADFPEDFAALEKGITERQLVSCRFTVMNAAFGALHAGSVTGLGVVIKAGSHANTAARHEIRGIVRQSSNSCYQPLGGAAGLGRRAYEAVVAAASGVGEATSLTKALLDAANFASVDDLVYEYARRKERAKPLKEFAGIVLAEATAGDKVALRIVEQEADTLACYAKAAADTVGLVRHVPIVLAGSVFDHASDLLPKLIEQKMQVKLPSCRVSVCSTPPVAGAVMLAFEMNGGGSSMFIRETLCKSLSAFHPNNN
jgi:N-acetylglucosamine kinase-like BadF-type ATPase